MLSYKGYSQEDIEVLLHQQCDPVLTTRQAAAEVLLTTTRKFLERQVAEWRWLCGLLGQWLMSLVGLFEDHKSKTSRNEAGVKAALREAKSQFEREDAEREAALEAAIVAVNQVSV